MIRYAFLCATLIALFVQGAIPLGLMPDFGAKTPGLHLVICDGVMPASDPAAMPDMPGMPMPAHHAERHDHTPMPPCPYAMAAALWFFVLLYFTIFRARPSVAAPRLFQAPMRRRYPFGNTAPRAPPR